MKKIAFLFCLILSTISLNAQQVESYKTSDSETLFFSRIGTGPKVLLIPGGPGYAASSLNYWVDSLSSNFECILFDLRGTGHAENVKLDETTVNLERAIKDINELRLFLGEDKLTLCGISFGGIVAQTYAANFPNNTKNIVLVSTLGTDMSLDNAFEDNVDSRLYPNEKDSIKYWQNHENKKLAWQKIMLEYLKPYFYVHSFAEEVLPTFLETNKYYGKMAYLMNKDLFKNYDINEKLNSYNGKCSIIRPRQDPIPEQTIYIIKDILPQTEIYYIEKCGHLPGLERPDVFFALLKEVL